MSEVCRSFRNNGHCRYGEECRFEHTEGEPITDWAPKAAEICYKFRDEGACDHGESCKFMHGEDDVRFINGVRDVSQEVHITALRPRRARRHDPLAPPSAPPAHLCPPRLQTCRNFQRGRCPLGEQCPRQHVEKPAGEEDNSEKPARKSRGSARKPRAPRAENADVSGEVCRNYLAGRCRLGESCRRLHEGDVEQAPVEKLDEVCNNFLQGRCRFGDSCRRQHTAAE
jgi:hypothetical protein